MAQADRDTVECPLDEEMEETDLGESYLERLRYECITEMNKVAEQKRRDRERQGQGEYSEVEEQEFLNLNKKSSNIVAHFYKSDVSRCKIFDHHFKLLAKKHIETRFIKLDAEKCPFLTGELSIKSIPTLLIITDKGTKDKVVRFSKLENCDDFSTDILEWYLGTCGAIAPTPETL